MRKYTSRWFAIAFVALVTTACGFKLRGAYTFPFASVTLQTPATAPEFGLQLQRTVQGEGTLTLLSDAQVATQLDASGSASLVRHAKVRVLEVFVDKRILSLSSGGKVREFQLEQRVKFDVVDAFDKPMLAERTISATREYSFTDAQALAKEGEERMLRADMQTDLIAQMMRQLQAARRAT